MSSSEAEEGFRVTDRRGRVDLDAPAEAPPPSPGASARPESPPPPPGEDPTAERSLVGLFVMLGTSAVVALGEAPDPTTGERHRDPEQAATVIDLLVLLREKTEGHRTPEETQLLDDLIYDLQLRYVGATRRSG